MKTKNPGMTRGTASCATKVGRRIAKPWCGAAGVFLFLAATGVAAQQPGDSVRVSGDVVGVVVDADSAGLLLSSAYPPYAGIRSLEIPYAEMRSLEVWRGTRTNAGRGFKVGFVAGAIAMGGFGWLLCSAFNSCDQDASLVVALAGAGGLLTGIVGSLIGAVIETDIWEPVPIPGGLSLRLAVGGG